MSVEIIIPLAAIIMVLVITIWLFKVFKASIQTVIAIAGILIVLQVVFGINSQDFIREVWQAIASWL